MKTIIESFVKDSKITFSSGKLKFSASGALAVIVFGAIIAIAITHGGFGALIEGG